MKEDEIQVEVEVNQQSVLRHQLTSESDTLNNVRVPSLERDEDIEKVSRNICIFGIHDEHEFPICYFSFFRDVLQIEDQMI